MMTHIDKKREIDNPPPQVKVKMFERERRQHLGAWRGACGF
jgi:hypothetical protein